MVGVVALVGIIFAAPSPEGVWKDAKPAERVVVGGVCVWTVEGGKDSTRNLRTAQERIKDPKGPSKSFFLFEKNRPLVPFVQAVDPLLVLPGECFSNKGRTWAAAAGRYVRGMRWGMEKSFRFVWAFLDGKGLAEPDKLPRFTEQAWCVDVPVEDVLGGFANVRPPTGDDMGAIIGKTEGETLMNTSLAVLAWLGWGNTHKAGPYSRDVEAALKFLLSKQDANGAWLAGKQPLVQALCLCAVAEAFAVSGDDRLRKPAENGLKRLLAMRTGSGAWGPGRGAESVFHTAVAALALKSCKSAGVAIGLNVFTAIAGRLRALRKKDGWPTDGAPEGVTQTACTAGAGLALIFCGEARSAPSVRSAVGLVAETAFDSYKNKPWGLYLATYFLFQVGGKKWREHLEHLLEHARSRPKLETGVPGGENCAFGLYALALEVAYRYNRYRGRKAGIPVNPGYEGILPPSLRVRLFDKRPLHAVLSRLSLVCDAAGVKGPSFAALKARFAAKIPALKTKFAAAFTKRTCGYVVTLPDGRALVELFVTPGLLEKYKDAILESLALEAAMNKGVRPHRSTETAVKKLLKRVLEREPTCVLRDHYLFRAAEAWPPKSLMLWTDEKELGRSDVEPPFYLFAVERVR